MKPRLTPEQAATLERLIDDLDTLYLDLCRSDLTGFQMGKISVARAELAFVLGSCHCTPEPVRLVVLEGAAR